jgi:pimeloyl-ACP methyl ester carboxylesterase
MQVGSRGGDNSTFVPYVRDQLDGKIYSHGPRGRSQAIRDIKDFLARNPDGQVLILGYSRGGRAAVKVSNTLHKKWGVSVTTLTTFDPHDLNDSSIPIDGSGIDAKNYFQQNPTTPISGQNPFIGKPVTVDGVNVAGADFTGDAGDNHVNIVEESLLRNRDEIE